MENSIWPPPEKRDFFGEGGVVFNFSNHQVMVKTLFGAKKHILDLQQRLQDLTLSTIHFTDRQKFET